MTNWTAYYKKMDNKTLIQSIKDHKESPSVYRGSEEIPRAAKKELARRKEAGQIRKIAGKSRQSSGIGLLSLSGRRIRF